MDNSPAATDSRQIIRFGRGRKILAFLLSIAAIVTRWVMRLFRPRPDPRRIVLLEPFGLGDIISLQPLLNQLLRRNHSVVFCGKPAWRSLFPDRAGFTWVDSRLPWGTHDEKAKYRLGAYLSRDGWRFLMDFRRLAGGGVGLETRGDIRSTLMLYLAGCARVVSLSNYAGSDVLVPRATAELVPYSCSLRRWEMNLRFNRMIEGDFAGEAVAAPAFPHLPRARTVGHRIGIIPLAPWAGKLWATMKWQRLTIMLRERGFEVVALCGPGQESATSRQAGGMEVRMANSVLEWSELLTACAAVVAIDTGPMHLADALGVPVVALFGQGLLPLWAPSGGRSCVIAHQDGPDFAPCQPIDQNSEAGRQLMDKISVEEVFGAVLSRV